MVKDTDYIVISTKLALEVLEVIKAQKRWIDAVPKDVVLPTMPGFNRDWAEEVANNLEMEV